MSLVFSILPKNERKNSTYVPTMISQVELFSLFFVWIQNTKNTFWNELTFINHRIKYIWLELFFNNFLGFSHQNSNQNWWGQKYSFIISVINVILMLQRSYYHAWNPHEILHWMSHKIKIWKKIVQTHILLCMY